MERKTLKKSCLALAYCAGHGTDFIASNIALELWLKAVDVPDGLWYNV